MAHLYLCNVFLSAHFTSESNKFSICAPHVEPMFLGDSRELPPRFSSNNLLFRFFFNCTNVKIFWSSCTSTVCPTIRWSLILYVCVLNAHVCVYAHRSETIPVLLVFAFANANYQSRSSRYVALFPLHHPRWFPTD